MLADAIGSGFQVQFVALLSKAVPLAKSAGLKRCCRAVAAYDFQRAPRTRPIATANAKVAIG